MKTVREREEMALFHRCCRRTGASFCYTSCFYVLKIGAWGGGGGAGELSKANDYSFRNNNNKSGSGVVDNTLDNQSKDRKIAPRFSGLSLSL